jgi:transcriptional regulator with XRE-family HTH domain
MRFAFLKARDGVSKTATVTLGLGSIVHMLTEVDAGCLSGGHRKTQKPMQKRLGRLLKNVIVMETHSFTFIVSGVDPHADDFEDRFFEAGCDDATLALMHGAVAVCFDRMDKTYDSAVFSAHGNVIAAGAEIKRFEPDYLVNAADIATRSGLTKAAISNYEKGTRGQGFPQPFARVTTSSPLWDWVEVAKWLYLNGKTEITTYHEALVTRYVNFGVQIKEPIAETQRKLKTALLEPVLA